MDNVLIIGPTGKLGSKVLEQLVATNRYRIGVFARNPQALSLASYPDVRRFGGDILKKNSLNEPIAWADLIINCSGLVSYHRHHEALLHRINVLGLGNIVDRCCVYQKKLIHTSSTAIYGGSETPTYYRESDQPTAAVYQIPYFLTKLKAEAIVQRAPLTAIILRPSSFISSEKSTLKSFYQLYRKGAVLGLKGGSSFVFLDDVAQGYVAATHLLAQATDNDQRIYNLGGYNYSIREAFALFGPLAGKVILPSGLLKVISWVSDYAMEPFGISVLTQQNVTAGSLYLYVDSQKATKELSYRLTSLSSSLQEVY